MARQFSVHSQLPPIGLLPPAADAAGRTGVYKSLRNIVGRVSVVFRINQGSATPVTVSLSQALNAAGLSAIAAPAVSIYYNLNTTLSDTFIPQTAAASFTTDAGIADKIVIFEFDPAELSINSGYNHLTAVTGASNAANITSVHMQGLGRYQQDAPPASEV